MRKEFLALLTAIFLLSPSYLWAMEPNNEPHASPQKATRKSIPVPTKLSAEVIEELNLYQSVVIEGEEYELPPAGNNSTFFSCDLPPFSSCALYPNRIEFYWQVPRAPLKKNPLWNPDQPHESPEFIYDLEYVGDNPNPFPVSLILIKKPSLIDLFQSNLQL